LRGGLALAPYGSEVMPVYEYKCAKCGKHFDFRQKFSDEPLTVHEDCGGELEKLISPPAFHFKGTGWYVTDYAKTNGNSGPDKNASKSEGSGESKPSESKSESKSDSKSDSKSETKSESKPASPAPATTSSESK
jgi:putative FmdB family regulatory protein